MTTLTGLRPVSFKERHGCKSEATFCQAKFSARAAFGKISAPLLQPNPPQPGNKNVTIGRLPQPRAGREISGSMKTKTEKTKVTPEVVRESGLKATQARRMADADDRVARAAKAQLKSAKKTWKLARKAAKRSAKRARHAEKEFRTLEKQLRRSRPKTKAKSGAKPKPAIKPAQAKRKPGAPIVTSAAATATGMAVPAPLPATTN